MAPAVGAVILSGMVAPVFADCNTRTEVTVSSTTGRTTPYPGTTIYVRSHTIVPGRGSVFTNHPVKFYIRNTRTGSVDWIGGNVDTNGEGRAQIYFYAGDFAPGSYEVWAEFQRHASDPEFGDCGVLLHSTSSRIGITLEEGPPVVVDPPDDWRPRLVEGWYTIQSSEAIGGVYWSTYNTRRGAVSRAIWEFSLPTGRRNYRVEVFVPRRIGSVPRTTNATYLISPDGPSGQVLVSRSQEVSSSQWVDLGSFPFNGRCRVELTDETGEPSFSHGVVANALRVTPQ
jgi:hypothetical protein